MAEGDFVMPEDLKGKSPEEIAKQYLNTKTEFEKFRSEYEPRAKTLEAYSKYGKPEEIEELVKWGKTYAPLIEKVAKGELKVLNDADWKAYEGFAKNGRDKAAQSAADDPDEAIFAPVRDKLRDELTGLTKKQIEDVAKGYEARFNQSVKALHDQMNLFAHVLDLKSKYPNVDFDKVIAEGADLAKLPADQLLDRLVQSRIKEATLAEEVERQVAAKLAEKTQQNDESRVKALLDGRSAGTLPLTAQKPADSVASLVKALGAKFPGIWESIPVI